MKLVSPGSAAGGTIDVDAAEARVWTRERGNRQICVMWAAVVLPTMGRAAFGNSSNCATALAKRLLDELPAGSSALVLAIEHLWVVPLRDAVRDAGGPVLGAWVAQRRPG